MATSSCCENRCTPTRRKLGTPKKVSIKQVYPLAHYLLLQYDPDIKSKTPEMGSVYGSHLYQIWPCVLEPVLSERESVTVIAVVTFVLDNLLKASIIAAIFIAIYKAVEDTLVSSPGPHFLETNIHLHMGAPLSSSWWGLIILS